MKIVVWKSYGDIKVYAAETAEQLEGIIDTMISCLGGWGLDDTIKEVKAHIERHKGNRAEMVRAFNAIKNVVGGDQESFEDIFLDTVRERCI